MSFSVAWSFLTLAAGISAWSSLLFRRGPTGSGTRAARMVRAYAQVYRSAEQPAVIRNLPVVLPIASIGAMPILLILVPLALPLSVSLPEWAVTLVAYGGLAYAFLLFGTCMVLLYRPPRGLVPRWLVLDDARIGYRPPAPGWFDRGQLVLGVLFLVGAAGAFLALVLAEGRLATGA